MKIVIDGVIFQIQAGNYLGIARVWQCMLKELVHLLPQGSITLLRRQGYPTGLTGFDEVEIPMYYPQNIQALDRDDAMLTQVCHELKADIFFSTYYTRALNVYNILMMYDMIPELFHWDLNHPIWVAKRRSIEGAHEFLSISNSTKNDLARLFNLDPQRITLSYCGVEDHFKPASKPQIESLMTQYSIQKPYYLLMGNRRMHKNSVAFFEAFANFDKKDQYQALLVGGGDNLLDEEKPYQNRCPIQIIPYVDDIIPLISNAVAVVYPSRYEGFGLPVLEAMACGCPVITGHNSSIPEVGGDVPIYINPDDPGQIRQALEDVLKPDVRTQMAGKGIDRSRYFRWKKMAHVVAGTILRKTNNYQFVQAAHNFSNIIEAQDPVNVIKDIRPDEALFSIIQTNAHQALAEGQMDLVDVLNAIDKVFETKMAERKQQEAVIRSKLIEPPIIENEVKTADDHPLVSVIVSTYKSQAFIGECLSDLVSQTIANRLEIIVIDAASPENERSIVDEFQRRNKNITYIRTGERISIYAAWNLAVKMANGKYLTSFSTNDRLRKDAYEIMTQVLEKNPQIGLVYGDTYITSTPHETFTNHHRSGAMVWPEYSYIDLLENCRVGPHPVWRRAIHKDIGLFDDTFMGMGDQDFWLRLGEKVPLYHIPVVTGLYWHSPDALTGNPERNTKEINEVRRRYRVSLGGERVQKRDQARQLLIEAQQMVNNKNVPAAEQKLIKALELAEDLFEIHNYYGQILIYSNRFEEGIAHLKRAKQLNPGDWENRIRMAKILKDHSKFGEADQEIDEIQEILPMLVAANHLRDNDTPSEAVVENQAPAENKMTALQIFNAILDEEDVAVSLTKFEPYFNQELLELVRANQKQASIEGSIELAEGLSNLADIIEHKVTSH